MKNNIPAIYNYCDRWCEKCPFTGRCAVYQAEQSRTRDSKDISNQAYWDNISSNLKKSLDLLHKTAEKFGVDLNNISPEEEEEIARQEEEKRRRIREHKLIRLSRKYGLKVKALMDEDEFWSQAASGLIAQISKGMNAEESARTESEKIAEYRETIGWYSFFISIKFSRALDSKLDIPDPEEEEAAIQDPELLARDENGTAKIALIAIERSIGAWAGLMELIPDEDRILPLLAMLEKIRKLGKLEFPGAEKFIRPGFDS
jgi:hypothetical protein